MPTILLITIEFVAILIILKIAYNFGYKDGQINKIAEFVGELDVLIDYSKEKTKHDTHISSKKRPVKKS